MKLAGIMYGLFLLALCFIAWLTFYSFERSDLKRKDLYEAIKAHAAHIDAQTERMAQIEKRLTELARTYPNLTGVKDE